MCVHCFALYFNCRCLAGQAQWEADWVQDEGTVRTNARHLYLCHQHDRRQGSQALRVPHLSQAAAHRPQVRRLHWLWDRFQSQALDSARRRTALWHQIGSNRSTTNGTHFPPLPAPCPYFLSARQQLLLLHVLRTRNVPVIIIVFGEKGPTTCVRLTPFCWTGLSVSCLALLCVRDTTSLLIIPSSCSRGTREPRASCLVPPATSVHNN